MNHVILTISGMNVQNEDVVYDALANSGYKGAHKHVDFGIISLDIGSDTVRKQAGIEDHEIKAMISEIIVNTSCSISSSLVLS